MTLKHQKAPAVAQPQAQAAPRGAGVADVVTAVSFARQHDSVVAVRGISHDVAGTAVCDGGLMIDLSFGLAATGGFVGARGGLRPTLGDGLGE